MAALDSIQSMLLFGGPPERRSESQIEDDLEAEFAFHLEMKARELIDEGHTSESARRLAQKQFGNVEQIKKRCKRIALEERIMLQRANFALMIVVVLMVIGVGVQVMMTQRQNAIALQDITSQIAKMKFEASVPAAERSAAVPEDSSSQALIEGDVQRPGWYPIVTHDGATYLRELLQRAGVIDPESVITRTSGRMAGSKSIHQWQQLLNDPQEIVVFPSDHVRVLNKQHWEASVQRSQPGTNLFIDSASIPRTGTWAQIDDETGQRVANGLTMEMILPKDLRYQSLSSAINEPIGYIKTNEAEVWIGFMPSYAMEVRLDQTTGYGRWTREGDQLLLDFKGLLKDQAKPVRLVQVGQPD